MSLKSFHIVFLTVCVLLMLFLADWCFLNYRRHGGTSELIWGALALVAAAGLIGYGRFFLKKLKHISYL